jgi:hypothetical protein
MSEKLANGWLLLLLIYDKCGMHIYLYTAEARDAGRLMSKFLSNPGEKHYEAVLYAIGLRVPRGGFLSANKEEYWR